VNKVTNAAQPSQMYYCIIFFCNTTAPMLQKTMNRYMKCSGWNQTVIPLNLNDACNCREHL